MIFPNFATCKAVECSRRWRISSGCHVFVL